MEITGKKVVSQSGIELGHVYDVDFEMDGSINYILVKPERVTGEMAEYLNSSDLLEVPYATVRAIELIQEFPKILTLN